MHRSLPCFGLLVVLLALLGPLGCTHHYNPSVYPLDPERIPALSIEPAVDVVNNQPMQEDVLVGEQGAHKWKGNLNAWTDVAVRTVVHFLKHRNVAVQEGAPRVLKLAVTKAELRPDLFRVWGVVHLMVETGSGMKKVFIGRNATPGSFQRAYDGAIALAVIDLLKDGETVRYLQGEDILPTHSANLQKAREAAPPEAPPPASSASSSRVPGRSDEFRPRREPMESLTAARIEHVIEKYDFFERDYNPYGEYRGEFVDNGDGTVTDLRTGLLWEKGGSSRPLPDNRARGYIRNLNKRRFVGYGDWRMPTVEELMTLMSRFEGAGLHIAEVFDVKQHRCWSSDRTEADYTMYEYVAGWVVSFKRGAVMKASWRPLYDKGNYMKNVDNYVRAVRSPP